MKTRLHLIALLLSTFVYSQDTLLGSWISTSININGEEFITPSNNEINRFGIFFTFDGVKMYQFYTEACQSLSGQFIEENNGIVTFLYPFGLSGDVCVDPDNADFEEKYFSFFPVGQNVSYSFEIIDEDDGSQTLIITTPEGDTLTYGNKPLSIAENQTNNFIVSPNPVENILSISMDDIHTSQVRIYSVNGKVLLNSKNISQNIDVSDLKVGVYFIEVSVAEEKLLKKFIKK